MSLKITSSRLSRNDVLHGQGIDGNGQVMSWTATPVHDGILAWSYSPLRQYRPQLYTEDGREVPWLRAEHDNSETTSDSVVNLKTDRLEAGVYWLVLEPGGSIREVAVSPLGEIMCKTPSVEEAKIARRVIAEQQQAAA